LLLPFALFLIGVGWLAINGAPDETGFWPVLLAALALGLLLAPNRTAYAESMLDGMSQRMVMLMLCAWLFAGALGAVLGASGLIQVLAELALRAGLRGGGFCAATFLVCSVLATATGTSFGTILLCGPLLYPAGGAVHADPAVLAGAILGGATFGDSISPISDTSIASSGTQQVSLAGTVRARLKYVLPAGVVAMVVAFVTGAGGADGAAVAAARTVSWRPLLMLASPVLVLVLLVRGQHLITALLAGVAAAIAIALAAQLMPPSAIFAVDAVKYTTTGAVLSGMRRAIGVCVFTLLLSALVATLQAGRALERFVAWAAARAPSPRLTEAWIVALVSAAVLLTTHSVVAILAVGDVVRRFGVALDGYRRANLLDLAVCTWPFLLPFFLPTILTASVTRGVPGMPALTPASIGAHNAYAWALVAAILAMVVGGVGRRLATPAASTVLSDGV
jgi:Na+/H+ antiporter NhaC